MISTDDGTGTNAVEAVVVAGMDYKGVAHIF